MKTSKLSFADLCMLLMATLVLSCLAAMSLRRQRAVEMKASCLENLRKMAIGLHNYHSAYKRLPMGSGGTDGGSDDEPMLGNASRLSALVAVSPFIDEQMVWEQIANPFQHNGVSYPPMGPVPWFDPSAYPPWAERPETYVCPAEPDANKFPTASSYLVNYGDAVHDVGAPITIALAPYSTDRSSKRGACIRQQAVGFRDFLDGIAYTLLISEARMDSKVARNVPGLPAAPSKCIAAHKNDATEYWPDGRDACWADGSLRSTGFQTILPPNSPSATSHVGELEGVMSVSSHHMGGVHVMFADANVRFVLDSIDAGDASSPSVADPNHGAEGCAKPGSPSPYGLWGAIGTRASRERIQPMKDPNIVIPVRDLSAEEKKVLLTKPLETWKTADGESFQARLVNVERRSTAILMTESNEFKRVLLSDLSSKDAYRAAARDVDAKAKLNEDLVTDLQRAVELLNDGKVDKFLEDYVLLQPNKLPTKENLALMIKADQARFIVLLERTVKEVSMPQKKNVRDPQRKTRLRSGLQVQYIDGRWRIILH